jgi:hypothetical protein
VLLAVIATALWVREPGGATGQALAQAQPLVGARGVFAFSGQLDRERFGLFMLDVDQGTLWCYELVPVEGVRKLRLVAARTFMYDRYLQSFNNLEPGFREVQQMVARERQARPADEAAPAVPETDVQPGADRPSVPE